MADDDSVMTPDMRATIGREGEAVSFEIDREMVRRLAEAVEEEDPAVLAAINSDDPDAPLPPYALLTVSTRMRQLTVPDMPQHALMAAEEFEVLAPIRSGVRYTATPRVADIQERIGGRVGHSLFVHHEWVYRSPQGDVVARVRRTIAHFFDRHSGE